MTKTNYDPNLMEAVKNIDFGGGNHHPEINYYWGRVIQALEEGKSPSVVKDRMEAARRLSCHTDSSDVYGVGDLRRAVEATLKTAST